ncbi:MAG: 50S ribosomal protein L5, partial [Pseudomonadota bacterium]|nr:50S ribosomal protein L5 [Pseudomonadota bacterium]
MVSRLQEVYTSEIRSLLQEQFGYSNPMQIPRLQKVVLNMGVGEAVNDSKKVDNALRDMT